MFYNIKYRIWNSIANWWDAKQPTCKHWFRVVSPSINGRRDIEVSECFWCKQLTSELYLGGRTFAEYNRDIGAGYGAVEACPVTDTTPDPTYRPLTKENGTDVATIRLPNKELAFYERNTNLAISNRHTRTRKKATKRNRRSKRT